MGNNQPYQIRDAGLSSPSPFTDTEEPGKENGAFTDYVGEESPEAEQDVPMASITHQDHLKKEDFNRKMIANFFTTRRTHNQKAARVVDLTARWNAHRNYKNQLQLILSATKNARNERRRVRDLERVQKKLFLAQNRLEAQQQRDNRKKAEREAAHAAAVARATRPDRRRRRHRH